MNHEQSNSERFRPGLKLNCDSAKRPRRVKLVLAQSLLLMVLLIGTGSFAKAAPIVGGEAQVTLHSVAQFAAANIGLSLIAPLQFGAQFPNVVFPIVGGDTATGTIQVDGGVIFEHGGNSLMVDNFVIDLVGGVTTVNTSLNGGPIESVVRSNNFNCAAMPNTCFAPDGITPINDPAFSGSVFSTEAQQRLNLAFPGTSIDFGAMLPDVSTVTSLHVVPLPGVVWLFGLAAFSVTWRRNRP